MAEGKRLRYVGPHAGVTIPAIGKGVVRNHQIVIEDADLAAALLEQDDWEEVGAKAKTPKDDAPADAPMEG